VQHALFFAFVDDRLLRDVESPISIDVTVKLECPLHRVDRFAFVRTVRLKLRICVPSPNQSLGEVAKETLAKIRALLACPLRCSFG
jgi:hypothetical protein